MPKPLERKPGSINCGGQAITVPTPARLICDRPPGSNRWVITLPIDAFFHSIQNWPKQCDVIEPEAFRPSSSTSAYQAKLNRRHQLTRDGFKRARWQRRLKQSIQDLQIAAVQNLRKLIASTQQHVGKELPRYGVLLNRAVLHFPFQGLPALHKHSTPRWFEARLR